MAVLGSGRAWAVEIPRKHHPWATFSPGAWRQVRVIVQVFDKKGAVVDWGETVQRTVLEKVDDEGVTLRIEESVWLAVKWRDRPAETIKQGFYGESEGQKAAIKDCDPETVVVEGRQIPCGVRQVQVADTGSKRTQVLKLWFNDDVAPYVLKRTATIKDPDTKTVSVVPSLVYGGRTAQGVEPS